MAYYGNLALRPEREPQQKPGVKTVKEVRRVVKRRQLPLGEKLLYLFTVAVCVVVACFILFRYAQIYELNRNIQHQKQQVEQLTGQMKELQREVERLRDPERIRKAAASQGYVPLDQQRITISADREKDAVAMKPQG